MVEQVTDLIRSDEGQVLLEKMRLEHGIADSDRNVLPFGLFGIRFKFLKDKEKFDETANQVTQSNQESFVPTAA